MKYYELIDIDEGGCVAILSVDDSLEDLLKKRAHDTGFSVRPVIVTEIKTEEKLNDYFNWWFDDSDEGENNATI